MPTAPMMHGMPDSKADVSISFLCRSRCTCSDLSHLQGKAKKRRKKQQARVEGAPKKPATSFVMFSNAQREQVKQENPGLNFIDVGKKLGEMWRGMDPAVKTDWNERATIAKDAYLEHKKRWLEERSMQAGENSENSQHDAHFLLLFSSKSLRHDTLRSEAYCSC